LVDGLTAVFEDGVFASLSFTSLSRPSRSFSFSGGGGGGVILLCDFRRDNTPGAFS